MSGFGKDFAVGDGFAGGVGADWSTDTVGFGVGDSRRLAFWFPIPELELPLTPKPPAPGLGDSLAALAFTFAFALVLLPGGLTVDEGWMPRSLSPVGVPVGITGWPFGSATSPGGPGRAFV